MEDQPGISGALALALRTSLPGIRRLRAIGAYRFSNSDASASPLPRHAEAAHRGTVRAGEHLRVLCLALHTGGEQCAHRVSHEHFTAIAVFGGPRFQADDLLHKIDLPDSHSYQLRHSPAIGAATLHQSAKPQFCVGHERAKLLILKKALTPRDGMEVMLCSQLVALHSEGMEFMRRAMLDDQTTSGVDSNVNRVARTLRTFATMADCLRTYRGGGQQKVTVEHVTVQAGGQAIVGTVNRGAGGGDAQQNGE